MTTQTKPQTAIQKLDPTQQKVVSLRDYIEARKANIAKIVPKHLTAERLTMVALAACTKEPKLLGCTPESVYLAVRQGAELGLEVGGALGHAYMVPMGSTATFICGYRGLIELAKRTGEVKDISARIVRSGDRFEVTFGYHEDIVHVPNLDEDGEVVAAYAIAILADGTRHAEVMTRSQLEAVKKYSKGGLANNHFEEWCRKTTIRRLVKFLPLSPEKSEKLVRAMEVDDENDGTIETRRVNAEVVSASRSEAIFQKVKAQESQDIVDATVEPPPPSDEPNADEVAKLEQELAKK